jgi:predicted DNA-binding transcriptional regulator YafY
VSHPASRVLALLELLQAHQVLPGSELARRLGVHERTLRRYANTLAELGVPVTATRGRYGGYRLSPGYKLPPLMFTEDEGVAVVLGLLAAERLGLIAGGDAPTGGPGAGPDTPAIPGAASATTRSASERHAGASALGKLRRVLPAGLSTKVAALEASLDFTLRQPRAAAGAATPVLLALGEAVANRYRVAVTYRNWRGGPSERELDPYGVVFHRGRWYVTGYDHARGDVRTFRLDRIAAAAPTAETFEMPENFDAVAQVTTGLAAVPYRHEVSVLLETDLDTARQAIPPGVGTLTEVGGRTGADGRTRLDCRAEDLDGMARLLAGLPWAYQIIEPDELRAALAAHATRLADYAGRR